jgi:tungstate transport system substrate-binding protein
MMNRNMKVIVGILICLVIGLAVIGMTRDNTPKSIILSTTTSTQDSGLLDEILPYFEKETGIEVKVVAVGTGKAIQMGVDGEADVLLVHAKASEEKFVSDGDGVERFDVMYNDFVLVGPKGSNDGLETSSMTDIESVLKYISEHQLKFVSRGDDSGTNKKEISLWKGLSLEALLNYYGVIAVNPNKNEQINAKGAEAFIKWILSDETQKRIGQFGVEAYGQPLFFPNAK